MKWCLFTKVLIRCESLKTDELVCLHLDLNLTCSCFSTSRCRTTWTWMFCLNVTAFVSKQLTVWNDSDDQGTGQDGFDTPFGLTVFFSFFAILERENDLQKEQNMWGLRNYSKSLTKREIYLLSTQRDPKMSSSDLYQRKSEPLKIMH